MRKAVLLLVLLVLPVLAVADIEQDAGVLPGNPLYFLDTGFDSVRYTMAGSAEAKAERSVIIADERLSEMQSLYQRQELNHIAKAKQGHDEYIEKLEENLAQIPEGELNYKTMAQIQNMINSHEKNIIALQREIEISNIEVVELQEENDQLRQTISDMTRKMSELNIKVNVRAESEYEKQNVTSEQVQAAVEEVAERSFFGSSNQESQSSSNSSSGGGGSSGGGASGGSAEGIGDDQVTICHTPGANQQTMVVPNSSLSGHLGHGDTIGACISSSSNDTDTNVTQTNQTTTNVTNTSVNNDTSTNVTGTPSITVTQPTGIVSGVTTISWTTENIPYTCKMLIKYCQNPQGCAFSIASNLDNDGSYVWDTTSVSNGQYNIWVYTDDNKPGCSSLTTSVYDTGDSFTVSNVDLDDSMSCTETDAGQDYFEKGTCTPRYITRNGTGEDYCVTSTKIGEWYCIPGETYCGDIQIECPDNYICSNGACVASSVSDEIPSNDSSSSGNITGSAVKTMHKQTILGWFASLIS
jgi:hypothetical protein